MAPTEHHTKEIVTKLHVRYTSSYVHARHINLTSEILNRVLDIKINWFIASVVFDLVLQEIIYMCILTVVIYIYIYIYI